MRSVEHDTLGQMGLTWLSSRSSSFRGHVEVSVAEGYVADALALAVFYHSEFRARCQHWGFTMQTIVYHIAPDGDLERKVSGDIPDFFSVVFECKATRADFLSTFGGRNNDHANRLSPVAHLHYVVVEPKVCTPDEITSFWGLLQRRGRGLSELKKPGYCPISREKVLDMSAKLLWKPPERPRIWLQCCPRCNGPLDERRPIPFSHYEREEPKHLMDDDPARDGADIKLGVKP